MRFSPPQPEADHDACGVGFIAQLGSQGSRDVVDRALVALAEVTLAELGYEPVGFDSSLRLITSRIGLPLGGSGTEVMRTPRTP